nr:A disintegrin and metalloproteinase with thrombospondin motifs 7-like [Macaca nemestrina]
MTGQPKYKLHNIWTFEGPSALHSSLVLCDPSSRIGAYKGKSEARKTFFPVGALSFLRRKVCSSSPMRTTSLSPWTLPRPSPAQPRPAHVVYKHQAPERLAQITNLYYWDLECGTQYLLCRAAAVLASPALVLHLLEHISTEVAGLFHDPSIGNHIHITTVRLVLLENEETTHHADNTLKSFCKSQKSINIKRDTHPLYHDTAILLSRKDLCAAMNRPCETLGLSHVAGICLPHCSCSINEDTGLPLGFTVAHELGHSFGIQHDGSGNDCEPIGKRPFIMSPQLLYDAAPATWSHCSRQYTLRISLCLPGPRPSTDDPRSLPAWAVGGSVVSTVK